MTQLLLTIIIGIGIAAVATAGALTLFQSARDGVDQQLLWARMEQAAAAVRAKTIIVDGLPTLPMPETATDSYPAIPTWVTAAAFDNNGKRFVYCPFALRDTTVEGTSTTVTGPGYSVVTYNSAITGSKDYVIGAVRPALAGTTSAAPQGLLGVLISFKPKDIYTASVAVNWCNNLSVSAAGVITASYSSQTGVVYPIIASQGPVQQAIAKRDVVTMYVAVTPPVGSNLTGNTLANATTLNAAFAQLAALRPQRAKLYLGAGTHTLSAIAKTDTPGSDVYNRGNLQQIIYDIEGAGSGSTTITLSTDYDLPVNTYWRSLAISPAAAQTVTAPANTKMMIVDSIVPNLVVKQGTVWVSGTSALNTAVTVTDVGRLVINGTVTSSVPDQGIKIKPGRVDVLPSKSWSITSSSAAATPSAPVIIYGGGTLSNSGTMTITSNGSTQLKSAINVLPGGVINMNNATMSLNSGSSTIAGDGATRKGAIVMGGEMFMVASNLFFPGGTSSNVAGVVLVDGGKFFMHAGSLIGSTSVAGERPYIGVYDNGGSQVGGSSAGCGGVGAAEAADGNTSCNSGDGGSAKSDIYANASGKCWDGNGDPYGQSIPTARKRHLFSDSDEGDTKYSSSKNTYSTSASINKLTYTDNLGIDWTNFGSATTTVIATGVAAQDGSMTAIALRSTRANTGLFTARKYNTAIMLAGQHKASIYIKAHAAGDIGKEIEFWAFDGGVRNVTKQALTGSWVRMPMTSTYSFAGAVAEPFNIGLLDAGGGGSSAATDVSYDLWGAQLESGTTANTYAPVGPVSATNVTDYRALRFTNNTDWLCHGTAGGGGGGDTVPDAFTITECGGLAAFTPFPTSTTTPTGFDTSTSISISCTGCGLGGANYSVNGGAWVNSAGTFAPGDNVKIQFVFCTNAAYTANLNIGGTTLNCTVTKTGRALPPC